MVILLALLAVAAYGGYRLIPADRGETVTVTVPPGLSIHEAASVVKGSGVGGSYARAAQRPPRSMRGLADFQVPSAAPSLEGFLYPGRYRLGRSATARDLVARQVARFGEHVKALNFPRRAKSRTTPYDALIVASLVEREAAIDRERPLIAAVIYNRLKRRIPLMIDATLSYALNRWTKPLRVSVAETKSPYNTALRAGLPPTPIGNPGLASLTAAANPADVGYLYYVLKPCGNGVHAFSSTKAQFKRDVAAYNAKRDELNGRDPTRC